MSRGYDVRRKARRQQARATSEPSQRQSRTDSRRLVVLLPVLFIAAILVATAILGFGASTGSSQKQIDQEVTALLAGIPQDGATLGSPDAPVIVQMFADLECPTVKHFVESHLPSIINTWVRPGTVKLEYRSLKTDTIDEQTFFEQEEAALAAGRQDRMWNFALTFARQQGQPRTEYATDAFFSHVASQVPELNMEKWNRDREDISLFKVVALGRRAARTQGFRYTPSFLISTPPDMSSALSEIQSSLDEVIKALRAEDLGDVPALRVS